MLNGKKILLGISGGIAAYKTLFLIRLLIKKGADVKVIVTKNALQFVTKVSLETISKNKIYEDTFSEINDYSTEHIALTDWADIMIVAPATANIIGKFANGIADDPLSTLFMAFNKPVFIAPSMNCKMYENFAVQKNIDFLQKNGVIIIDATLGDLACGYEGKGRMEEPENILDFIDKDLKNKSLLKGKKILITAGPTYEAIDPVRFIGNHSSGKMGFALAEHFADLGALVRLVTGPVSLKTENKGINRYDVVTAAEMYRLCISLFKTSDIIIMAAAVADFTIEKPNENKIKKNKKLTSLKLTLTKDILKELGTQKTSNQTLVGFALETNDENDNAITKLKNKNLDFIVLNSLNDKGAGFGHETNKISIFDKEGNMKKFDLKSKKEVAADIADYILNK
jgi:phosphopantothenoylcysteine decarboxylase/phosphopantothenate--cysteine ligase